MARMQVQNGQFDRAVASARAAHRVDPENAEAVSIEKAATKMLASGQAPAVKAAPPEVKPAPAPPSPKPGPPAGADLYEQARQAKIQGDITSATSLYQQCLAKGGCAKAHKQLGIIYATQGKNSSAIDHYKKYIEAFPNAADSQAIRATIERLGGTP
jgi:tetratricopeptide (TPR) repeat protein